MTNRISVPKHMEVVVRFNSSAKEIDAAISEYIRLGSIEGHLMGFRKNYYPMTAYLALKNLAKESTNPKVNAVYVYTLVNKMRDDSISRRLSIKGCGVLVEPIFDVFKSYGVTEVDVAQDFVNILYDFADNKIIPKGNYEVGGRNNPPALNWLSSDLVKLTIVGDEIHTSRSDKYLSLESDLDKVCGEHLKELLGTEPTKPVIVKAIKAIMTVMCHSGHLYL